MEPGSAAASIYQQLRRRALLCWASQRLGRLYRTVPGKRQTIISVGRQEDKSVAAGYQRQVAFDNFLLSAIMPEADGRIRRRHARAPLWEFFLVPVRIGVLHRGGETPVGVHEGPGSCPARGIARRGDRPSSERRIADDSGTKASLGRPRGLWGDPRQPIRSGARDTGTQKSLD